ncbi:Tensin-4 [Schistosoma japonicum]|nr:Tensin-4 [Schistosoma japonicum]
MTTKICREINPSHYNDNQELFPNSYHQDSSTDYVPFHSEIYGNIENRHQTVLRPNLHDPLPCVVHNPHTIKLKRSCHNTKCRYCFPNASDINNRFEVDSRSSSSESTSQINTRNSLNTHNYKKYLNFNRPSYIIQEEITVDDNRQEMEDIRQKNLRREDEIPVFKEIRVTRPLVNHTTLPNIIDNYVPTLLTNSYHLEDCDDRVYWIKQETPLRVYTNGITNNSSSRSSVVYRTKQPNSFIRKSPVYKSQIIPVDVNFTAPQRTMSHTNVYGPRSWNLRSYQGSEYSLMMFIIIVKISLVTIYTLIDVKCGYIFTTVDEISRKELTQKKSMGNTEAFEEFETITLQPIGRGVQDLDSHVGSLTTLARGGGASSMIEVHKHTSRTPRMYSPISCQFNRAHSTTPTRYSRPTRGFSNNLYKSQPVFGGSMEAYPMFKSRTPDPGRDITGSPLWTALPRNSSTTPTTYKSWRSERNITNMLSEPITYDDVMLNTQMAKIQVLESSDLPATLFPYSKKSIGQQPIEVVKKDIKLFETEGSVWSGQLDKNEPEMINLKKVVSMKKPPERSRLWALPDSMKIVRSSNGYLPLAHHPNDINLDDDGQTIDHELDLLEPGTTMLRTEINGLSHIDDHQHPRASSRASLARQPFASTQYLNRQNYNHDGDQTIFINRGQPASIGTTVQSHPASRIGTPATFSDVSVTTSPQTIIGPTKVISNLNVMTTTKKMSERTEVPLQNGWKPEKTKQDLVDSDSMAHVNATARVWYRPKLSREEAISILRQQVPGSFLIRDSTTYKDAFGLAVKVATLPPKVTPKSDDLQSELVRHYLIEAVNTPTKGVRLKGFASEPVFPSLAALINRHTQDALALPCRLILPAIPTTPLPQGYRPPSQIVTGIPPNTATDIPISNHISPSNNEYIPKVDSVTGPISEIGSVMMDNGEMDCTKSVTNTSTVGLQGLPFECVIKDEHQKQVVPQSSLNQGITYRCFMLGSVDTPQWNNELCFARAVDQLIPLESLTASECDHGISRVRYSDIQLHVSAHDGITIIDLLRRLFLRRHLPNNVLLYCGVESRKKEFIHPEHQNLGIRNPKIFGLVVRKGISECTCHIFSECDPVHSAESIVNYIQTIYPHLKG